MELLGIENQLRIIDERLFTRYSLLKDRLITDEYNFWAMGFPGGNDHGPGHIIRVFEKLDNILSETIIDKRIIGVYELFLTMMSVLYHDIGMLQGRSNHAVKSSGLISELIDGIEFYKEDNNSYLFDIHDRDIIRAVIECHSSKSDIEAVCQGFAQEETIAGYRVRPRIISALVRLADELDEDYRRAPVRLMERMAIPEQSQFYWLFCQRISGIQPNPQSHLITIYVKFEQNDIGRVVFVDGKDRLFLVAFAEKLEKINHERYEMNKFLPNELQFTHIIVSVKPLENHPKWKQPKEFLFTNGTTATDFINAFSELLVTPVNTALRNILVLMRKKEFLEARSELAKISKASNDLPSALQDGFLYLSACVESRLALSTTGKQRQESLDNATEYLKMWIKIGQEGAWQVNGKTGENEIFRMSNDNDLYCLFKQRFMDIKAIIPDDLIGFFRDRPPSMKNVGQSGCVMIGTDVMTPRGLKAIETIRNGDEIISIDNYSFITTKVVEIHSFLQPNCFCINDILCVSPMQCLYEVENGWIPAKDLSLGMKLLCGVQKDTLIFNLSKIEGCFYVYDLTTNHPSHNYLASNLLCHNKRRITHI
jgi:hypothetical protein